MCCGLLQLRREKQLRLTREDSGEPEYDRNGHAGAGAASRGLNWHIYPRPLSCINKCWGRLRSISVSISRFTCSALSQQGSECSSVECLITGAVGREGRRLDIKTLAFWKSDTLLTRVLLSQRRDLVSADCSLVLGAVSYRAPVTGAHWVWEAAGAWWAGAGWWSILTALQRMTSLSWLPAVDTAC